VRREGEMGGRGRLVVEVGREGEILKMFQRRMKAKSWHLL
jgi:hypothetical protein